MHQGVFKNSLVKLDESYPVGAVLGYLEVSAEEAARLGLDRPVDAGGKTRSLPRNAEPRSATGGNGKQRGVQPTVRGSARAGERGGASYMSPRMKARMDELGLHAADLAGVAGQRRGGPRDHPGF